MKVINIYEAKTNLSNLVTRALAGEEIIIGKYGEPMVKLEPVTKKKKSYRQGGQLKGNIWVSPDFDRYIPEEFLPYL